MRARVGLLTAAIVVLVLPAGPLAAAPQIEVATAITSHEAQFFDSAHRHVRSFAYTGETSAAATTPAVAEADVIGAAQRLPRAELAPNVDAADGLAWLAAARGLPMKVNAQDDLPVHVVAPARANPYLTRWYQRQETATDLWHWGGVLAGSQVGGAERSENAVFGRGPTVAAYPDQAAQPPTGRLEWDDQQLLRSAVSTDVDPATGKPFSGTFWGNLALPSLRVTGGDAVFDTDTSSPPLVLSLPVRPSGLLLHSTPSDPPGVDLDWAFAWDFDAATLTIQATVKAGSRWPESSLHDGRPTWQWTPTFFLPGWDYGDLINGGGPLAESLRAALEPASIRPDGTLALSDAIGDDGLPVLPAGLLDLNLPPGTFVTVAGNPTAAPQESAAADAEMAAVDRDGIPTLVVTRDGEPFAELSVPAVTVDGEVFTLDASRQLDAWASDAASVALYEAGGVFLDVILTASDDYLAYYLYDAHSIDGASHEVALHTHLDPAIGGADGDGFREPFYTDELYPVEAAVPQGVIDLPVGTLVNSWYGSLPAVQAVDTDGDGGSLLHLQVWPNHSGLEPAALATTGYLLADHGEFDPDPDAAVADREPIAGADVAFDLVNRYRGTLWDDGLLPWFSFFMLDAPSAAAGGDDQRQEMPAALRR